MQSLSLALELPEQFDVPGTALELSDRVAEAEALLKRHKEHGWTTSVSGQALEKLRNLRVWLAPRRIDMLRHPKLHSLFAQVQALLRLAAFSSPPFNRVMARKYQDWTRILPAMYERALINQAPLGAIDLDEMRNQVLLVRSTWSLLPPPSTINQLRDVTQWWRAVQLSMALHFVISHAHLKGPGRPPMPRPARRLAHLVAADRPSADVRRDLERTDYRVGESLACIRWLLRVFGHFEEARDIPWLRNMSLRLASRAVEFVTNERNALTFKRSYLERSGAVSFFAADEEFEELATSSEACLRNAAADGAGVVFKLRRADFQACEKLVRTWAPAAVVASAARELAGDEQFPDGPLVLPPGLKQLPSRDNNRMLGIQWRRLGLLQMWPVYAAINGVLTEGGHANLLNQSLLTQRQNMLLVPKPFLPPNGLNEGEWGDPSEWTLMADEVIPFEMASGEKPIALAVMGGIIVFRVPAVPSAAEDFPRPILCRSPFEAAAALLGRDRADVLRPRNVQSLDGGLPVPESVL